MLPKTFGYNEWGLESNVFFTTIELHGCLNKKWWWTLQEPPKFRNQRNPIHSLLIVYV